ncbi:hypothetical protein M0802_003316 [Mischocyttarus mexicanus]|nr:hypothetical protein M0802_003316 [Mischocyttarus mexicanus]
MGKRTQEEAGEELAKKKYSAIKKNYYDDNISINNNSNNSNNSNNNSSKKLTRTVDVEMEPGTILVTVRRPVEEDDLALVPALIALTDVCKHRKVRRWALAAPVVTYSISSWPSCIDNNDDHDAYDDYDAEEDKFSKVLSRKVTEADITFGKRQSSPRVWREVILGSGIVPMKLFPI